MKITLIFFSALWLLLAVLGLTPSSLRPALAGGDIADIIRRGTDTTADKIGFDTEKASKRRNLIELTGQIINNLLAVLGVLFMVLILSGGFIWMNARGNEEAVIKAKKIILSASIGIIVILLARTITFVVLSQLLGKVTE